MELPPDVMGDEPAGRATPVDEDAQAPARAPFTPRPLDRVVDAAEPLEPLDLDREAFELAERERRLEATVDVVVVLHQSRAVLERHLASMLAAVDRLGAQLIAVDNASTDGAAPWLRGLDDPRIVVVNAGANLGYAAAVNLAVERSTADCIVLLNPDVGVPDPDALRQLAIHLERHPRVGVVAPRLTSADGELQRSARCVPSLSMILARQSPLGATPWGRRLAARYLELPAARGDAAVPDWVIGAAMAIRRTAFEAVGGWDDRFFLYFEDVDFCVRLRAAGWLVHYLPGVALVHDYARGSDRASGSVLRSWLRRRHIASAVRFFVKHPGLLATGRGEPLGWRPFLASVARRAFDVVAASLLLLVAAPLMAAIALAIRIDSRGPVWFRQVRVGRHESTFTMLKFRTMADGADAVVHERYVRRMILDGEPPSWSERDDRPVWKLAKDARVTRVGAALRRWSLDELPQLINVLRGEMSLVGFRPAIPYELKYYPDEWFGRFAVKPGMTGVWQVNGRNECSYAEMVRYDLGYARGRSWRVDAAVLARTPRVVLQRRGAL